MTAKRKGKRKRGHRQSSGLEDHRRHQKKLHPPLAQVPVPMKPVHWERDVLPEFLLIDAAAEQRTWDRAPAVLHGALDILDQFVSSDSNDTLLGTISSMALVVEDHRAEAREALVNSGLDRDLLPQGLRHGLALYPECPAAWLLADWQQLHTVDWEEGVRYLKGAVRRLWASKSVHSTRCRMLPLARMMKHHKLVFPAGMQAIELLPRYPRGLTADEQGSVESTARALFMAAVYGGNQRVEDWPVHFWRHSYRVSLCEDLGDDTSGTGVGESELRATATAIEDAAQRLSSVINRAARQASLDIYDLDRDEVLFGLLSRQYRLFRALAMDPTLWTMDLAGMFHRAMMDALITFRWLAKQNDLSQFTKFKKFSLGKQKLLKLHIQELVDGGREDLAEFEEYLSATINEEGWEELLSIDLGGNFAGKDMRTMAHEVGMRELYNLVFSPASAELHGEWVSLKRSNLVRCGNPLHRFHLVPQLQPPTILAPGAVLFAGSLLLETLEAWLDSYQLKGSDDDIEEFTRGLEAAFSELWGLQGDGGQNGLEGEDAQASKAD